MTDKVPQTLDEFLQTIEFKDFLQTFLSIWDYKINQFTPWTLWPKQHYMCEMLHKERVMFWAKARQVGGSMVAGAYAVYVALSEPNSEVIIISKSEPDAKYFLKNRIKPFLDTLPKIEGLVWGTWEMFSDNAVFSNGSMINCLTTSEDAGRGRTTRLIVLDEAGAIEHARQIWSASSPSLDQNPRGQILVISNSKNGSWFNEIYRATMDGKVIGASRYFLSLWADPKRNERWREITRSKYMTDVDFYTEYPETEEHLFLSKEGRVYPDFDSTEGGRHVSKFEPMWTNRYIYGYDDGFVHYSVFLQLLYDPLADHLYVLDEMYETQKDTSQISKLIMSKIFEWRQQGAPQQPWKKIADTAIFARKGQKTVAEIIRMHTGIAFSKSLKHDEEGSTQMLRIRFTKGQITIHPRCHNLIRQIRDLMFDKNGKASDKDNDGIDVLRYVCAEIRQEQKVIEPGPPKPYSRESSMLFMQSKEMFDRMKNNESPENNAKSWQAG